MSMESRKKWREKHNITHDDIKKYDDSEWEQTVKSIDDVKIVLAYGREFSVKYKGIEALITTSGCSGFSVQSSENFYDTDDLDEFGEQATLGPYLLKDIVGKWEITWHA